MPHAPSPPHTETGLGSGGRLHTRPCFVEVPRITHYLPQANVARDGQSERQCNVLHGLSHGSVQNPANTEVPPTAAPRSVWGRARPATAARQGQSPPGEETKTRFRNARSPRLFSPSFFPPSLLFLPSFLSLKKKKKNPVLGSCTILENEKEGSILQAPMEDPESLNERVEVRSREKDGESDFKSLALSQSVEGGEFSA